jgi:AmmeMemoRadiSam system protein A
MEMTEEEKEFLLNLARRSIEWFFENGEELCLAKDEVPKSLTHEAATFVTLSKNGELRGCIGKLEPVQMLYIDVVENACSSAFSDYRFVPLDRSELKDIKIEISVLSKPQLLEYASQDDLINILNSKKPGVIISKGFHSATFLPQVWEELDNAELFLSQLCQKAVLEVDEWKDKNINISTYTVVNFSEK